MIPLPSLTLHALADGQFELRANDGDWYLRATFPALRSALVLGNAGHSGPPPALDRVGRS